LVFYPKKDFLASAIRIPSLIIGREVHIIGLLNCTFWRIYNFGRYKNCKRTRIIIFTKSTSSPSGGYKTYSDNEFD